MDHREIKLLGHLLQVKHMAHLHARIITFISNIYVTGKFQTLLSVYVLPAVMELLLYNITTHKPTLEETTRETDNLAVDPREGLITEQGQEPVQNIMRQGRFFTSNNENSESALPTEYQLPSNFGIEMYKELIESICFLMGNLTTSGNDPCALSLTTNRRNV